MDRTCVCVCVLPSQTHTQDPRNSVTRCFNERPTSSVIFPHHIFCLFGMQWSSNGAQHCEKPRCWTPPTATAGLISATEDGALHNAPMLCSAYERCLGRKTLKRPMPDGT
jgi:hypothetical protein